MIKHFFAIGVLVVSILALFGSYFFQNKVLFPANLLASFYNPWKTIAFPGWEQGIPNKPLGYDNLRYFYPVKKIVSDIIRSGRLPLWNPYNFAGSPLLADGQSAIYYPFNILYTIYPLVDAFSIMVIFVPTFSFIFMYILLHHFRVSFFATVFGAFTFAFSGFMSVWMEENPAVSQTAIWLPLLLYLLDTWIFSKKSGNLILFALCLTIMLFAGFLQISIYILIFIIIFGLWRIYQIHSFKQKKETLLYFFLAIIIGLLISSVYLVPVWEAYQLSPREYASVPNMISTYLVQWSHVITLIIPDWLGNPGTHNYYGSGSYYDKIMYIGAVPFLFVLYSLYTKKRSLESFMWYMVMAIILLGFSTPFSRLLLSVHIPILSSMIPSRIFYLTTFALSIIAAIGFEKALLNTRNNNANVVNHKIIILLSFLFLVTVIFGLMYMAQQAFASTFYGDIASTIRKLIVVQMKISPPFIGILTRNTLLSLIISIIVLVLINLTNRSTTKITFLFILLISISHGIYYTQKSISVSERQFVYASHPVLDWLRLHSGLNRVIYADEASRIPTNINEIFHFYSPEGLNPVFPRRYGELIYAAQQNGIVTNNIPRIEVSIDNTLTQKSSKDKERLLRLYSLLGVKYIVEYKRPTGISKVDTMYWKVAWENNQWRIWEYINVFPRAFIVPAYVIGNSRQEIVDTLFNPSINLLDTIILEDDTKIISQQKRSDVNQAYTVDITNYTENNISMKIISLTGGFLFLSDNYFPGWKAYVDGIETMQYRANYSFRAIPVTPGFHTVNFEYKPESLVFGLTATIMGLMLLPLLSLSKRFLS